jgi:integrase
LRQRKGGVRVVIPVGASLKAALDAAAKTKKGPLILVNSSGQPWTPDGFRASWRNARAAAGVVGVTFHDLRGTAVTRLALVGCTEAEIAAITGQTLRDVRSILDANYLHRDPALERDPQARKGNKNSQLSSQRSQDVQVKEGGKLSEIKWLGD